MAAKNPKRRDLATRKARMSRYQPGADTSEIDRELKYLSIEEHIITSVDAEPSLTDEQRARLAALLQPAGA